MPGDLTYVVTKKRKAKPRFYDLKRRVAHVLSVEGFETACRRHPVEMLEVADQAWLEDNRFSMCRYCLIHAPDAPETFYAVSDEPWYMQGAFEGTAGGRRPS